MEEFFGVESAEKLARKGFSADLMVSNNVLAHVPNINDFVKAYCILLKPDGVATFEFPYLINLFEHHQFDTIYHEHFSYLSLTAVEKIFKSNGLRIFDVEKINTHGGSLRVFAERQDSSHKKCQSKMVSELINREKSDGYLSERTYTKLQGAAEKAKDDLLKFLINAKEKDKSVYAYGAAAKGNTFINFFWDKVGPDFGCC